MTDPWDPAGAGVLRLPSGRLVRGRSVRSPLPSGPRPTCAVYLLGTTLPAVAWESRWLRWPDLWLPSDQAHARTVLHEAWESALTQRVEIACHGGRGRTGTALACLAIIDGVPPKQAVAFVRRHYDQRAVETPLPEALRHPIHTAVSPLIFVTERTTSHEMRCVGTDDRRPVRADHSG